jgi:hypothetical protein
MAPRIHSFYFYRISARLEVESRVLYQVEIADNAVIYPLGVHHDPGTFGVYFCANRAVLHL